VNPLLSTIRAEAFKLIRRRRTYILAALWWLLIPILLLIVARALQGNLGGSFVDEEGIIAGVVQSIASPLGLVRANLVGPALISPTVYIITAALLAGVLIGEERSRNMWKTVLTAQHNRVAILTGKILVAMLFLLIYMVGAMVSGLLFGTVGMLFLDTTFDLSGWWVTFGHYVLQWSFLLPAILFAFLMVYLFRNVALGMVSVFFLPALVEGVYSILRAVLDLRPLNRLNAFFQAMELRTTFENLPRYFFTNNLYAPARQPIGELTAAIGADIGQMSDDPFTTALLRTDMTLTHSTFVMAGYAVLFGVLLYLLFLRADVD